MYKHSVTYQKELHGDVIDISEGSVKIYRKGKVFIEFNAEEFEKIINDYEEINS